MSRVLGQPLRPVVHGPQYRHRPGELHHHSSHLVTDRKKRMTLRRVQDDLEHFVVELNFARNQNQNRSHTSHALEEARMAAMRVLDLTPETTAPKAKRHSSLPRPPCQPMLASIERSCLLPPWCPPPNGLVRTEALFGDVIQHERSLLEMWDENPEAAEDVRALHRDINKIRYTHEYLQPISYAQQAVAAHRLYDQPVLRSCRLKDIRLAQEGVRLESASRDRLENELTYWGEDPQPPRESEVSVAAQAEAEVSYLIYASSNQAEVAVVNVVNRAQAATAPPPGAGVEKLIDIVRKPLKVVESKPPLALLLSWRQNHC